MSNLVYLQLEKTPYVRLGPDVEKIVQYSDGAVEVRSTKTFVKRDITSQDMSISIRRHVPMPIAVMFYKGADMRGTPPGTEDLVVVDLCAAVLSAGKLQNIPIEEVTAVSDEGYTIHGDGKSLTPNPTGYTIALGKPELTFLMQTADSKIYSCGQSLLYESLNGSGWCVSDESGWREGEWPTAEAAIESTK